MWELLARRQGGDGTWRVISEEPMVNRLAILYIAEYDKYETKGLTLVMHHRENHHSSRVGQDLRTEDIPLDRHR